jgi:hypothetical protein
MNFTALLLSAALLATGASASSQDVQPPPAGSAPFLPAAASAENTPPESASPPSGAASPKSSYGIFPIWGDKVRQAGFELPPPFGVMVNYYYQRSKVKISNLKLGVNDGPLRDASFIEFGDATARGSALAVRPSIMILPFLSFYGVVSSGSSGTDVAVTSPTSFTTTAESGATVLTLGATLQAGYKGFFAVADFNASVADVERIADLMGANLLSFRLGYNYRFGPEGRGIALWAGASGQVIAVDTSGSVTLAEVLPPPSQDQVDRVQARCDQLGPRDPRRDACLELAGKLQDWTNGTDPKASVSYSLEKRPKDIWNMLLGAQFALDRNWQFRVEAGFLGSRTSALAGTEYRFDIH